MKIPKKIYIIQEKGDDYHGSGILSNGYTSKKEAIAVVKDLTENQDPCPDCDHKYHYTVTEIEITPKKDSE